MVPGAGAPMQKSELATFYLFLFVIFFILLLIQIGVTIYDLVKKKPNETSQLLNNGKNLLILLLLIVITWLLPNEWGTSSWEALIKALE